MLQTALERAYCALYGLAVGDALGALFEFSHGQLSRRVSERMLPQMQWHWTDDTHMALMIYAVLRESGAFAADDFVATLMQHYDRSRGYGRSLRAFVQYVRTGEDWRVVGPRLFGEQGSFGNACASRVAPLAAFYADDLRLLCHYAAESARVTHAHAEAQAGTIAVCVAVALAWQQRALPCPPASEFLGQVLEFVPKSELRQGLLRAQGLGAECSAQQAAQILGNGSQITVQDTVPFALWCAATRLDSYEEAIWRTLEGQGDCDTTAAIVGGVLIMRHGLSAIPDQWRQHCEPLPTWALGNGV
jgi:ADP-ribosylglycohydrolase